MEKLRRRTAAEQTRQLKLAAGGPEEIVAANDERHTLDVIVHRRRELIRPVAVAIACQQVAALLERPLLLRSMPPVDEMLERRLQPNPQASSVAFRQPAIAARARIPKLAGIVRL